MSLRTSMCSRDIRGARLFVRGFVRDLGAIGGQCLSARPCAPEGRFRHPCLPATLAHPCAAHKRGRLEVRGFSF